MRKLLTGLALSAIVLLSTAPANADCHTSCAHYTTGNQMCVTCCRVCFNANGEETYSSCDTRCVDY